VRASYYDAQMEAEHLKKAYAVLKTAGMEVEHVGDR
jgi:hypothetical protein